MIPGKVHGNNFESIFEQACRRAGIVATRFPDGCKTIGVNRIIRVKTPWDWILSWQNRVGFFDTKTDSGSTFPHSAIELHQVEELLRHEKQGVIAGYVVWFRKTDQVVFFPASVLRPLFKTRGSLDATHPQAISIGSVVSLSGFNPSLLFP